MQNEEMRGSILTWEPSAPADALLDSLSLSQII
jgi:hypothetical protein